MRSIPGLADLLFPVAARILMANLPVDGPVDVFISRLILERDVRAIVAVPALVWQADAYNKGDIVHTNVYKPAPKPARRPRPVEAAPEEPPPEQRKMSSGLHRFYHTHRWGVPLSMGTVAEDASNEKLTVRQPIDEHHSE